jgi:carbon storage regulator
MLVLSRNLNESLVINGTITITVLQVNGDKVKIGIEAPPDVVVLRQELFEAIEAQKALAAKVAEHSESEAMQTLRQVLIDELDEQPAEAAQPDPLPHS